MYNELVKYKIISIISKVGTNIAYKFTDSFWNYLHDFLEENRYYIIIDDTIDIDIVDLQGVIKAVCKYLPEDTPKDILIYTSQFVFNSIMSIKYGLPIPKEKNFTSRIEEFFKEVYSMELSEEIGRWIRRNKKSVNSCY